jgi:hypothetical protein
VRVIVASPANCTIVVIVANAANNQARLINDNYASDGAIVVE